MADLFDFWNGTTPSSATSEITSTSGEQPAWLQDYTRSLMGTAVNAAEQPYAPYTEARIAGQDPLSQQASTMAQGQVGGWKPGIDFAASKSYDQIQNYMNPYQNQVVDRIAQLGQRNLTENLLPQVNTTFTGAGQFGSTRNADFANRALRDTNEAILGQQGQLLNQGYQQGMQNFMNEATRVGNVAAQQSQLGSADVSMLDLLGRQNQSLNQQNLDLNYQNFLEQREQPKQSISWLNEIVRGLPTNTQTYQTSSALPQQQQVTSPLLQAAQAFSGVRSLLSPTQQTSTTSGMSGGAPGGVRTTY